MSRSVFEGSFPNWKDMLPHLDPMAQSLFSKRIGLTADTATASARAA